MRNENETKKVIIPFSSGGLGINHEPVPEELYRPAFQDGNNWKCKPPDFETIQEPEQENETESLHLSGLAGFFFLTTPGAGLSVGNLSAMGGFIVLSIVLLYFLFRFGARRRQKIEDIKSSEKKQIIPEDDLRHENYLGNC